MKKDAKVSKWQRTCGSNGKEQLRKRSCPGGSPESDFEHTGLREDKQVEMSTGDLERERWHNSSFRTETQTCKSF